MASPDEAERPPTQEEVERCPTQEQVERLHIQEEAERLRTQKEIERLPTQEEVEQWLPRPRSTSIDHIRSFSRLPRFLWPARRFLAEVYCKDALDAHRANIQMSRQERLACAAMFAWTFKKATLPRERHAAQLSVGPFDEVLSPMMVGPSGKMLSSTEVDPEAGDDATEKKILNPREKRLAQERSNSQFPSATKNTPRFSLRSSLSGHFKSQRQRLISLSNGLDNEKAEPKKQEKRQTTPHQEVIKSTTQATQPTRKPLKRTPQRKLHVKNVSKKSSNTPAPQGSASQDKLKAILMQISHYKRQLRDHKGAKLDPISEDDKERDKSLLSVDEPDIEDKVPVFHTMLSKFPTLKISTATQEKNETPFEGEETMEKSRKSEKMKGDAREGFDLESLL